MSEETEITQECLDKGYYGCQEVKDAIDSVLHQNAVDRANLGSSSSKTRKEEVKRIERQRLRTVRHLDPEKIDRLLKDND